MTEAAHTADVLFQVDELKSSLELLLVPDLDPYLAETLAAAIASAMLRGDAALRGAVMVTVGATYESLRELIMRIGDRQVALAGEASDRVLDRERTDSDAAGAARAAATLAALAALNMARRVNQLEERVTALEATKRGGRSRTAAAQRNKEV